MSGWPSNDPFSRIESGPLLREAPPAPPRGGDEHLTRRFLAIIMVLALAAVAYMAR